MSFSMADVIGRRLPSLVIAKVSQIQDRYFGCVTMKVGYPRTSCITWWFQWTALLSCGHWGRHRFFFHTFLVAWASLRSVPQTGRQQVRAVNICKTWFCEALGLQAPLAQQNKALYASYLSDMWGGLFPGAVMEKYSLPVLCVQYSHNLVVNAVEGSTAPVLPSLWPCSWMGWQAGALGCLLHVHSPFCTEEEKLTREGGVSSSLHKRRLQVKRVEQKDLQYSLTGFCRERELALNWAQGYSVTQRGAPGQRDCHLHGDEDAGELLSDANSPFAWCRTMN